MHDETVKAERAPEIPSRIEKLLKMLDENEDFINQLDSRLQSVMSGSDNPAADRPVVSSQTTLGEKLAQCNEKLNNNNLHLTKILDRLEV